MPRNSSKELPASNGQPNTATTSHPLTTAVDTTTTTINPLSHEEIDIFNLISRFLLQIRHGDPMSFNTFKAVWTSLHFSYIYEAIPQTDILGRASFIQRLYSIALSCIMNNAQKNELMLAVWTSSIPIIIGNGEQGQQSIHCTGTVSQEDLDWLSNVSDDMISLAGLYCLYCLYYAQPGNPAVQIRISTDIQNEFLDSLQQLKQKTNTSNGNTSNNTNTTNNSNNECGCMIRTLHNDGALILGCTDIPDKNLLLHSTIGSTLPPGVGIMNVVPRADAEDAATLREVKFHLDSTLTGLGTGHLDQLCMNYKQKLDALWDGIAAVRQYNANKERENNTKRRNNTKPKKNATTDNTTDDDNSNDTDTDNNAFTRPEGIADLTMGKEIHALAHAKGKEVQLILRYGRNYASKLNNKKTKRKRQKTPATTTDTTTAATPGGDGDAAAMAAINNIGAVQKALRSKEDARQKDIRRREHTWAQHMGMNESDEDGLRAHTAHGLLQIQLPTSNSDDIDMLYDDMPSLPGYPSMFQSRGGGFTSSDGESIDDRQKKKKVLNNSSSSDSSDSSDSDSSSSSSSSSSSDSDTSSSSSSEDEEERGGGSNRAIKKKKPTTRTVSSKRVGNGNGSRAVVRKRAPVVAQKKKSIGKKKADDIIREAEDYLTVLDELIGDV